MINADLLCSTSREIFGEWFIDKPLTRPLLYRLKDAIEVLKGNAVAVTFTENIDLRELIIERSKVLIDTHKNYVDYIKDSEFKKVLDLKLSRELQKIGVVFVGNELKIKKYDIMIVNDGIVITTDSKVIDINDTIELSKFYIDVKFKFLYDKILLVFKDIETNLEYMKNERSMNG